ncbi:hypothetical protein NIES2135_40660 [Leptolyngbya boryana NIES-2135]|jgi:hypothetical protein|uniref:Uncharacterized protein n=2 Tax=Leptolyngbya boryana TaxID=1184 RepID=A0A1Z4JKB8_LEPBY|nr:hypothetical protein NIES2135_40660 [Leptolyngbya boryana NIES-2135]
MNRRKSKNCQDKIQRIKSCQQGFVYQEEQKRFFYPMRTWIRGILLMAFIAETNTLSSPLSNPLQAPSEPWNTASLTMNRSSRYASLKTSLDPAFHDSDPGVPNDAKPDGVPSHYTWYESATQPGFGNHPPAGWHAITMLGHVYPAQGWKTWQAPNTRIQIKGAETWILSKSTKTWKQVQKTDRVAGASYVADFAGDANQPADIRDESRNGGGISVAVNNGYLFHFWAERATMNPTDIAGVYAKFEARLVKANPNGVDDLDSARYIASAGADYWRNHHVQWAADWSNNGQVAGGRFKWVARHWKVFAMTTMPAEEIKKNPPPLNF